jgi:hypothetical protein
VIEVLLLGRDYYCLDLEGLGWEGYSAFDGERLPIHSSVEEVLTAVSSRSFEAPVPEIVGSICGIRNGMTREDVLDPLLELFENAGPISPRIKDRENGEVEWT